MLVEVQRDLRAIWVWEVAWWAKLLLLALPSSALRLPVHLAAPDIPAVLKYNGELFKASGRDREWMEHELQQR